MRRLAVALSLLFACEDDTKTNPVDAGATDAGADAVSFDAGDGAAAVVPKGARTLGVAIAIDRADFPEQAHAIADAGARSTNVSFPWDDVEIPYDGGTALSQPGLHIAGLISYNEQLKPTLAIPVVDAKGPHLPVDLVGRPLDDTDVRTRYAAAIDYGLAQLSDVDVGTFLVATDTDVALGTDTAQWTAFATFVDAAVKHSHVVKAGIRAGFVVTSSALRAMPEVIKAALAASDIVAVTHVGDVDADLDSVIAAAPPGKPVVVYAIGRPSGGGDQAKQAAFVGDVFASWDRHVDRIPSLTFFELDDAPDRDTTFGLRKSQDGKTKPAFGALVSAARARGF